MVDDVALVDWSQIYIDFHCSDFMFQLNHHICGNHSMSENLLRPAREFFFSAWRRNHFIIRIFVRKNDHSFSRFGLKHDSHFITIVLGCFELSANKSIRHDSNSWSIRRVNVGSEGICLFSPLKIVAAIGFSFICWNFFRASVPISFKFCFLRCTKKAISGRLW